MEVHTLKFKPFDGKKFRKKIHIRIIRNKRIWKGVRKGKFCAVFEKKQVSIKTGLQFDPQKICIIQFI